MLKVQNRSEVSEVCISKTKNLIKQNIVSSLYCIWLHELNLHSFISFCLCFSTVKMKRKAYIEYPLFLFSWTAF